MKKMLNYLVASIAGLSAFCFLTLPWLSIQTGRLRLLFPMVRAAQLTCQHD